jgi:hypothetical protein
MHCEHSQEVIPADHASQQARKNRLVGAAVALPCLMMLLTAAMLQPRQCGYGTHEQLGLGACYTLKNGWPCPSCGLTTSVTAMTHGQVSLAWQAQPFGIVLFVLALVLVAPALGQTITGLAMLGTFRPGLWWVPAGIAGMMIGWGWNLYHGIASGSLPLR